jgi:hypothetical protein
VPTLTSQFRVCRNIRFLSLFDRSTHEPSTAALPKV